MNTKNDKLISYAKNGNLKKVKFLVENGADVRVCDDYALRAASRNGHLDVVNYLKSLDKKPIKNKSKKVTGWQLTNSNGSWLAIYPTRKKAREFIQQELDNLYYIPTIKKVTVCPQN